MHIWNYFSEKLLPIGDGNDWSDDEGIDKNNKESKNGQYLKLINLALDGSR